VRTARPGFSSQRARHTACRGEGFYGEFSEKLCRIGGMVPHGSANRAVGYMLECRVFRINFLQSWIIDIWPA
jgi:hypothetical protein